MSFNLLKCSTSKQKQISCLRACVRRACVRACGACVRACECVYVCVCVKARMRTHISVAFLISLPEARRALRTAFSLCALPFAVKSMLTYEGSKLREHIHTHARINVRCACQAAPRVLPPADGATVTSQRCAANSVMLGIEGAPSRQTQDANTYKRPLRP